MKAFFLPFLFLISFTVVQAQEENLTEAKSTPPTLSEQFNALKNNSNSYQGYKVIKLGSLNSFWKNVQDSITAAKQDLIVTQKNINEQEKQLQALKKENALKEQEVQQSAYNMANISVLGLDMQKQHYVILNFIIIILLLIGLGIVVFLYNNSKRTTDEKQKAFSVIDLEYNEYKKQAREKELKIKRELQTELNRIEELNQQIATLKKQAHV